MQILKLDLDHCNFYCPVTGQVICDEKVGLHGKSPALKGIWINLKPDEPIYVSPELREPWEAYVSSLEEDDFIDAAEFLMTIDEPRWVAFEHSFNGVLADTSWIVIDMNHDVST